jgi:hypothetical protein
MTHLLSQTYEGKGMKEFAEDYVRGCAVCQENKPCMTHRKAPLQPITPEPHSGPFQMVAMDLIMDLPESNGFNAILTIINHGCSKATKFIPCTTNITGCHDSTFYPILFITYPLFLHPLIHPHSTLVTAIFCCATPFARLGSHA